MGQYSTYIVVQITHVVDDSFPVFVACEFADVEQRKHEFVEKLPVVSDDAQSSFPKMGRIACTIEKEYKDESGQSLVEVNTEALWGIASQQGETKFVVASSELIRI